MAPIAEPMAGSRRRSWIGALIRLAGGLLALGVLIFAVANRHSVPVSFEPFVPIEIQPPLFVVLFFGIFVGILAGWLVTARRRFGYFVRTRRAERKATALSRDLSRLEQKLDDNPPTPAAQTGAPIAAPTPTLAKAEVG